jgi:hypothetical protein
MAAHLNRRISIEVTDKQRAGSDNTHIPTNYLDEFGQFIQTCAPKKTPKSGDPFTVRQQFSSGIELIGHRAKLEKCEHLPV